MLKKFAILSKSKFQIQQMLTFESDIYLHGILLVPRKIDKNHPVLKSGSSLWFCETVVHASHTFGPSKLESVNSLSLSFLSTSIVKRYLSHSIISLERNLIKIFFFSFFFIDT